MRSPPCLLASFLSLALAIEPHTGLRVVVIKRRGQPMSMPSPENMIEDMLGTMSAFDSFFNEGPLMQLHDDFSDPLIFSPPMFRRDRHNHFNRMRRFEGRPSRLFSMLNPFQRPHPRPSCACREDVVNLCIDQVDGDAGDMMSAKVTDCLLNRKAELHPRCLAMLNESPFVCHCHASIARLCPDVVPGEKRVYDCLKSQQELLTDTCLAYFKEKQEQVAVASQSEDREQKLTVSLEPATAVHNTVNEAEAAKKFPLMPLPPIPANTEPAHTEVADESPDVTSFVSVAQTKAAPAAKGRHPSPGLVVGVAVGGGALVVFGAIVLTVIYVRRSRRDYRPLGYIPMLT